MENQPQNTATGELQQLIEDSWEFDLRENPLFATACGDRRYNDQLTSMAVNDIKRRLEQQKTFRDRHQKIDRSQLSHDNQINYDIFGTLLENSITEDDFQSYLMPFNNVISFHISFPQLPTQVPLETMEDFDNYISRLNRFKSYVGQNIDLMKEGVKQGYVMPKPVLEGFEAPIEAHIVDDPTKSVLYQPLVNLPRTLPENQHQRLREATEKAIRESIVPAYQELLNYVKTEYFPACRDTFGTSELPWGKAFYEHRVRHYTSPEYTPQQVHDTGLAEVERIRSEMDEVISGVGFTGSFSDFVEFLRTNSQFYVDTPEDLLKETSYILKKMDGLLPRLFRTLPRTPYGIVPVPEYSAGKAPTAYYMRPLADGSRGGFYYLNTSKLNSRPLYELEALSLHEAVPGHHLQIALQQELTGIPEFRKYSGFTGYIEGWALYSERLGLEVGFYENPYSNFGRLIYEMWRACRLVVDTGIHYFGWSRDKAVEYMSSHSALTVENIRTEVDRYITWPGQAVSYKMGELKFRELRKRAEEKLADKFDIRAFHDVALLHGAVPLQVLEDNIDRHIAQAASA